MAATGRTKTPLSPIVDALEAATPLDAPAKLAGERIRGLLKPGAVKDAVSGTWLGHALHPILTDVVIGAFVSASMLDLIGPRDDGRAAERLLAVGLAAYGPTALTGFSDWADSELGDERVRRLGLVHAASNATAASLYTASLVARRRGSRGRGTALALGGAAVLGAGGFLGGHLSFVRGVGVDQTAFDPGPADWTAASLDGDLVVGEPQRAVVDDTPVLMVRHADGIHALHDRCSHRGCSLADGKVEGEFVTCVCHDSQFDLRDGSIQRGPATAPQPAYDVRESGGRLEIRLRESA